MATKKTDRKKPGRPAAGRPAKRTGPKKVSPKRTVAEKRSGPSSISAPAPVDDRQEILDRVGPGSPGRSIDPSDKIAVEPGSLNLVDQHDAAGAAALAQAERDAAETKPGKKKAKPKKPGSQKPSDKKPPADPVPGDRPELDVVSDLLRPDAIKSILNMVNAKLREDSSIWAASDIDEKNLAISTAGMIEKYFPESARYSVEGCFLIALAMYAFPRFSRMFKDRKAERAAAAAAPVPEKKAKPAPVAQGSTPIDSRLTDPSIVGNPGG